VVLRPRWGVGSIPRRAKHFRDRVTTDVRTQIGQRSIDSQMAPTAVFYRHAYHQILDLRRFSRSASRFTSAIIFLRDQPAMPGQQGFGRNNRSHLSGEACLPMPLPSLPIGALVMVEA
jgi:hypothetical protein